MAIAIFIAIRGTTEIAITYELLAMIDLFGAETFVLLYISGFLVLIEGPVLYIKKFYTENVTVPSLKLIKEDLRYLYFLIPVSKEARVYVICAILVPTSFVVVPDFPIWGFIFSGS